VADDDVCISTDFVEASDRSDFWREVTRPLVETLPLDEDRHLPLHGAISSRMVGPLQVGSASFNRQRYHRDRRHIAQSGLDHYFVHVMTSGAQYGDFDGVDVAAETGDICIFDLAQGQKSQVEAGSTTYVVLPRQPLEKALGSRKVHGAVLKAHWPVTRLIVDYMDSLCSLETPLPGVHAEAVHEAMVTLLCAALRGGRSDDVANASPFEARLRQRILEFIRHNVHLQELSPDFLCQRFKVSRAHLYRAFAADGGVATVMREMRLDAAYHELTQLGRSGRSITEIAYSLGFSSSNQLLRSFRARFGVTPSEARAGSEESPEPAQRGLDLHSYFARYSDKTRQD
jgi:AraC-like DNA-binding protein